MENYIAYYRVSTNKQKNSGLGLEDQKQQVLKYINSVEGKLLKEFEDVESGSKSNRPNLIKAIEHCTLTNSTLVIAKLDRLSRNVAFLAKLLESQVRFVCCDNPHANKLTIHILSAVAEEERRLISQRTKAALAQAKTKGIKLGTNNLPKSDASTAQNARDGKTKKATLFYASILPTLSSVKHLSYRKQAEWLNNQNIKTRTGGNWYANSVKRIYLSVNTLNNSMNQIS